MSMQPEPEIADIEVGDGRCWHHLRTAGRRIAEAEALGLPISELGAFIVFDPHETEAYLSLRAYDGTPIAVALVGMSGVWDVRGRGGREGTAEEWALARGMAPAVHAEVRRQAGFEPDDVEDAAIADVFA